MRKRRRIPDSGTPCPTDIQFPDSGFRFPDSTLFGYPISGFRIPDSGFGDPIYPTHSRYPISGFRIRGPHVQAFGILGCGFRIPDSGFQIRVSGFDLPAQTLRLTTPKSEDRKFYRIRHTRTPTLNEWKKAKQLLIVFGTPGHETPNEEKKLFKNA